MYLVYAQITLTAALSFLVVADFLTTKEFVSQLASLNGQVRLCRHAAMMCAVAWIVFVTIDKSNLALIIVGLTCLGTLAAASIVSVAQSCIYGISIGLAVVTVTFSIQTITILMAHTWHAATTYHLRKNNEPKSFFALPGIVPIIDYTIDSPVAQVKTRVHNKIEHQHSRYVS